MKRAMLDRDIKPLSEFRSNAAGCIQQIHESRRPLLITQNGKGAVVLLDVSEYESLLEKLELLQDVQTAERQLDQAKGVEHKNAKKQILRALQQ